MRQALDTPGGHRAGSPCRVRFVEPGDGS